MAQLMLYPPMPRMLGVSSEFTTWEEDVPLSRSCTLQEFLERMAREVNPLFEEAIARREHTYYEKIRIAVDGRFARSDDYSISVNPDSVVIIMSPMIDG